MNENEIIDEVLDSLVKSFRSVNGKLPHYEESDAKYTTLLNTQTRISKLIVMCISLKRNPKLQLGGLYFIILILLSWMVLRILKIRYQFEFGRRSTIRDPLPTAESKSAQVFSD